MTQERFLEELLELQDASLNVEGAENGVVINNGVKMDIYDRLQELIDEFMEVM